MRRCHAPHAHAPHTASSGARHRDSKLGPNAGADQSQAQTNRRYDHSQVHGTAANEKVHGTWNGKGAMHLRKLDQTKAFRI